MKKHIQIVFTLLLLCFSMACLAGPPYSVDDPSTVEAKHFNLTTVYQSSQSRAGETQAFPNFTLAYGPNSKVELDLNFGAVSSRGTGAPRVVGFGDTVTAIKWRFLEETKRLPQIAVGYQIKIPTADVHRGLGSGTLDNTLWISAAKSFGRAMFFGNVGYNLLGGHSGKNNTYYGAGVTFQLTQTVVVGADVYGNSPNAPNTNNELAWGVGLSWNIKPDRALLLHLGRSERGFSDLNVYAGYSITFK